MPDRVRLVLHGRPAWGSVAAHYLEEEGLDVTWSPPREFRNGPLSDIGQLAIVYIVEPGAKAIAGATTLALAHQAVRRIREKFSNANIQIDIGYDFSGDDPAEEDDSAPPLS